MDAAGVDTDGKVYDSPDDFWEAKARQAAAKGDKSVKWYEGAVKYWDDQPASDDGVLGGFGAVSPLDIRDSRLFLEKSFSKQLKEAEDGIRRPFVALDCGAGVGRVSELLLLQFFDEVDLVEPSHHLIEAAKSRLCKRGSKPFPSSHKAVNFYQCGLEAFNPEPQRYDVIWVQWAMLYLTDVDAAAFLKRCAAALKPGGKIYIKENVCDVGFLADNEDASVTRSHEYYQELFAKMAGLMQTHTALQKGFPKDLFKVRMYALKPDPITDYASQD